MNTLPSAILADGSADELAADGVTVGSIAELRRRIPFCCSNVASAVRP
jgi:hypothetical protein